VALNSRSKTEWEDTVYEAAWTLSRCLFCVDAGWCLWKKSWRRIILICRQWLTPNRRSLMRRYVYTRL